MTGEAPSDGRAVRQTALWTAYRDAARELQVSETLIARDEKELLALRNGEPIPVSARHLREAAETGASLEDVLTHDRQDRIDELEHALECEGEMRDRDASKAWAALREATHLADIEAESLSGGVAEAASAGITASLAEAKKLISSFTKQIRDLVHGAPIPVTAWHLRAASEYGQSMDEVLAHDRSGMIAARAAWIDQLTQAMTEGRDTSARWRRETTRPVPRGIRRTRGASRE